MDFRQKIIMGAFFPLFLDIIYLNSHFCS
uniref:Uncharacterized protein n=1 Tax=Anguilla anguilla TaxID=7936 RepID=A0A0E9QZE0_ANGAN